MLEFLSNIKWQMKVFGVLPIPKEQLPSGLRTFHSFIDWFHIVFRIFLMLTYISAAFGFLLFVATTFIEYIVGTFIFAGATLELLAYISLLFKRSELLALMVDLEATIDRSKFSKKFEK